MAKKKVKKVSEIKRNYQKQVKRIKQTISRAEKRGYIVDYKLPEEPKRITKKSVERLQKVKPEDIYKKSKFVDKETGEIFSGLEGRKLERKKSAEKAKRTREANKKSQRNFWTQDQINEPVADGEDLFNNFYDQVLSRLEKVPNDIATTQRGKRYKRRYYLIEAEQESKSKLKELLDQALAKYGKMKLGWVLQDKADEINTFIDIIEYASDQSQIDYGYLGVARILNAIINGSNPSVYAEFKEMLDEEAELFEDW